MLQGLSHWHTGLTDRIPAVKWQLSSTSHSSNRVIIEQTGQNCYALISYNPPRDTEIFFFFWGMWFTVPFDIESNVILLQQSKFCSLYWSAIYPQHSISFRYTTWFNICIYCKMTATILLVICHHRTKKKFFLWWKLLRFTFLATIKFVIWYY